MKKNKTPELKFSGFVENWDQLKLQDVSKRVRGNDGRMDIPTLTISAAKGWLDQRVRFSRNIAGKEQKNYTLLSKGDLSYNRGNSKLAKYGVVFELKTYEEALVPKVYHSFKTTKEASAKFIEYMFETKKPDRELAKLVSSSARMDGLLNINYDSFVGININIPKIDEQNKIAEFFYKLDEIITLQEQELENLKQTKQGFLQKMFPKKGELFPEMRFPGHDNQWEEFKLEEIGQIRSGIGFPNPEQGGQEGIPFYKVSDMNNIGNEKEMFNSNNYVTVEQIKEKNWLLFDTIPSVIFAKVGAALMLDRKRLVTTPFLIDNNLMAFSFDETWDINFGYILFQTLNLSRYAQIGALPSFNATDINSIKVKIPIKKEQTKIGNLFKELDETINLHQQELDALQETKKAFLQKMFV